MNNKNLKTAVTLGAIAAAALVLFLRYTVGLDTVVAYGATLGLAVIAATEYGFNWKKIFGR
jgi:hypothetical protein